MITIDLWSPRTYDHHRPMITTDLWSPQTYDHHGPMITMDLWSPQTYDHHGPMITMDLWSPWTSDHHGPDWTMVTDTKVNITHRQHKIVSNCSPLLYYLHLPQTVSLVVEIDEYSNRNSLKFVCWELCHYVIICMTCATTPQPKAKHPKHDRLNITTSEKNQWVL